ncbi:MAG: single-stranded DNA-binding protein [Phycisphaerae bacterium]|nr:single-stranded DNA-binding protein [Phycisphaerae bacterium]
MANLNKVMLIGNLTRDPDLKFTAGNQAVCELGIAVNRKYKTKDGEEREDTTFVDCEAWGRQAEVLKQYLTKGRPLFVEGRLKLDTWEDKDGQKRSKMRVVIENFQFLGSGQGGGGGGREDQQEGASSAGARKSKPAPARAGGGGGADGPHQEVEDEHIPF